MKARLFVMACAVYVLSGCASVPSSKQENSVVEAPMPLEEQQWRNMDAQSGAAALTPVKGKIIRQGFVVSLDPENPRICYYKNSVPVRCGPVTTGRSSSPTPRGRFSVKKKEVLHISSKYPPPNGGAMMWYSLQFYGGYFIHLGPQKEHADSHGCIRVSVWDAKEFFKYAEMGDLVWVL